jgi:hypothetical protein
LAPFAYTELMTQTQTPGTVPNANIGRHGFDRVLFGHAMNSIIPRKGGESESDAILRIDESGAAMIARARELVGDDAEKVFILTDDVIFAAMRAESKFNYVL